MYKMRILNIVKLTPDMSHVPDRTDLLRDITRTNFVTFVYLINLFGYLRNTKPIIISNTYSCFLVYNPNAFCSAKNFDSKK